MMPKRKVSKPIEDNQEKTVKVEDKEKPSSYSKKSGDEIDEIFASKKRKKTNQQNAENPKEEVDKKQKLKKKNKKRDKVSDGKKLTDPSSIYRPRKKTAEGFAIYSEEELGINRADGGGTPLCPFDCSCCF